MHATYLKWWTVTGLNIVNFVAFLEKYIINVTIESSKIDSFNTLELLLADYVPLFYEYTEASSNRSSIYGV